MDKKEFQQVPFPASNNFFYLRLGIFVAYILLKVLGKGAKERMVPIGSITRHYLKEYLASCPYQSENTFVSRRGKKLTCDAVKHLISKVAKQLPWC